MVNSIMIFVISFHAAIANIRITTAKNFGGYSYTHCLTLDTARQSYICVMLVLVAFL
jgi:hypothetical protein